MCKKYTLLQKKTLTIVNSHVHKKTTNLDNLLFNIYNHGRLSVHGCSHVIDCKEGYKFIVDSCSHLIDYVETMLWETET